MTPLHIAAERNNLKIVELLLDFHINSRFFRGIEPEHEIKINEKDDKGQTPLIKAIVAGHIDVAKLLIENDADVNVVDNDSKTALMIALQNTE